MQLLAQNSGFLVTAVTAVRWATENQTFYFQQALASQQARYFRQIDAKDTGS
ncbi:hypothetical protein OAD35_04005 [Pseudomonadales bacterium]|nr:hypothetical protein [Pseudomonadales bacterium]